MYYWYKKYLRWKDEEVDREPGEPIAEQFRGHFKFFWRRFNNEPPGFQVTFICTVTLIVGFIGTAAYQTVKLKRMGYAGLSHMEPMTKPLAKAAIISPAVGYLAGTYYLNNRTPPTREDY